MGPDSQVSVVMSVYNDAEYLQEAIDSVLEQTFENFEFIVVDDASTDGSQAILERVEDDRLSLLENDENRGLTASLNRAIGVAEGTYIARQDADDRSHPERLERQIEFLETHPEVALVGTGARLIDESGEPIERRVTLARPSFEALLAKNRFVHGSVMLRRDVLLAVNGYDERFSQVQDYELWLRLARDHELRNIPDPLYDLRIHADSVYFRRQEESVLYAMLARRMARDDVPKSVMDRVETAGIDALYEHLTTDELAEYHLELAMAYLRYDESAQAREEAVATLEEKPTALRAVVPIVLSLAGFRLRGLVLRAVRTVLNTSIQIRNRLARE